MPYVYPGYRLANLPKVTQSDISGNAVQVLQTANATPRPSDDAPTPTPYVEFIDGYRESFPPSGGEATRMCVCLWDDRWQFIRNMIGYSQAVGQAPPDAFDVYTDPGTGGQEASNLKRYCPEPHPNYPFLFASETGEIRGMAVPSNDTALAKALSANPQFGQPASQMFSASTNGIRFSLAVIPVIYRARDYLIYRESDTVTAPFTPGQGELNRFVSRYVKINGENLPIPGNTFFYVTALPLIPQPLLQPVVKIFPSLHLVYKWWQVPCVDGFTVAKIARLNFGTQQGFVNSEVFDGYPAGTLLLLPPDISRPYVMVDGHTAQDIEFNIIYRPKGHNYIYRGGSVNNFVEVSTDGSPYPSSDQTHHIYPGADLNQIFQLTFSVSLGP